MPTHTPPQQTAISAAERILQQAMDCHQSGQKEEAERLYRAILLDQPNHPQANHNLAALTLRVKGPDAALPYFMAALDADPACGQYWLDYIDALFQAGQCDDAQQVLALARQQGLAGAEVDDLARRLEDAARLAANAGETEPHAAGTPPALEQNRQKAPSRQEVETLAALFKEGRFSDAMALARSMTERFPLHWAGWKMLGVLLKQMGRSADALAPMQQAAALAPGDAGAHNNLALILQDLNRLDEAEACYRRAIRIKPEHAQAHANLGLILQGMGRLEESEASLRQALRIKPDSAEAHNNLGNTLKGLGRLDEAEASYRRALQLDPDLADAHYNLGIALQDQGRLEEAEASYRRALQIKPDHAAAHNNLGSTLKGLGRLDEAEASCRKSLQVSPDYADARNNLGAIYMAQGRLIEAEACYQKVLESVPDNALALSNLGVALQELGRLDEAEACYREALRIDPDFLDAHSNLLLLLNYNCAYDPAAGLAEALEYGRIAADKVTSKFAQWSCPAPPQRLRIGLVSGDFRNHSVGYFLEGLLARFGSTSLDLIAFPTYPWEDELTERIKSHFSAWIPLYGLSDEAGARLIHDNGIHVLIDLSGHTAHNRLPMFAWKPAPVQASWLGYLSTTGLAAMDYLIADPWTLPEKEEGHFSEKILRLPETYLCFTPPDQDVAVAPLPAIGNGYVTFGCFNNLTKMNDAVVAVWAQVLQQVPDSRLFLKAKQLKEASVRQSVADRFATHGIDARRLTLEGNVPLRTEHLASYNRMDIALDPFPYPGITTSVEGLWMGVPFLTLAGESFLSRQGVGLLANVGLPEWIASDTDEYIARAVSHAGDLQRLAYLREELRPKALASPLFDALKFARRFEKAMWEIWNRESNPFWPRHPD